MIPMTDLASIDTPAPMRSRVRAFEAARAAYARTLDDGAPVREAMLSARDAATRTLRTLDGVREIVRLATAHATSGVTVALASADPAPEPSPALAAAGALASSAPAAESIATLAPTEPEPVAIAIELAPVAAPPRARRVAVRLPRAAYAEAAAVRCGLADDLTYAFERIWRGLWATMGRATLAEAFAEWCEAHADELVQLQMEAADAVERKLTREMNKVWREAYVAKGLVSSEVPF